MFHFDHIVINVVDIEKMLDFYTEILQLPGERLEEFSRGQVPFPSVRLSPDSIIDLFPKPLWEKTGPDEEGRPNLNHFCLSTDEKRAVSLHNKLRANGITIDEGPVQRWGAHGTGTSIYFRDPEGNVIEVRYYQSTMDQGTCLLNS